MGSAAGVACIGGGMKTVVGITLGASLAATVAGLVAVELADAVAGLYGSILFLSPILVALATIGLPVPP